MRLIFAALLLCSSHAFAAPATPVAESGGLLLAQDSKALQMIVVSSDASAELKATAKELAEILGRVSGGSFEIQVGDGSAGIVLGRLEHFPVAGLEKALEIRGGYDGREAFAIRTEPQRLLLLGATDLGVSHAAFRFLEALGYRHFFPAKEWEVVPKKPTLRVSLNEISRPAILSRALSFAFAHYGFDDPALAAQDAWRRHNRVGQSFRASTGHAVQGILLTHAKDFEEHPEWLALRGGKRQMRATTHNYETAQLCLSNAELRGRILQWSLASFRKNPATDMVSMEPNDGIEHCECDECKKLGSTTERAYLLANEVARAVSHEFPGKMVGMLAYSDHSAPPSSPLEPNVHVQLTKGYNYGDFTFDELLSQWVKKTPNLGFYTYWSVYDQTMDMPFRHVASQVRPLSEAVKKLAAHRARSLLAESVSDWGISGRGYYLASKLMWDPEADPTAILKDFYDNAFGPAAAPMQRFYEALDGTEVPLPGEHNIGQALFELDAASHLGAARPDVSARISALKQYMHYVHLYTMFSRAKGQGAAGVDAARSSVAAILEHVVRTRSTMLNSWVAFVAGWSQWRAAEYQEPTWSWAWMTKATPAQPSKMAEWFTLPPPDAAEIDRGFKDAQAFFPVPPRWEAAKFSSELVAVNWGIAARPQPEDRWTTAARYAFISRRGEPLAVSLKLAPGNIPTWNGSKSYRLLDQAGKVVAEGRAAPEQGRHRVELQVPAPGTYSFELENPAVNIVLQPTWTVAAAEPGSAFSLDLTRGSITAVGHQAPLYFYVPKGTRELKLFSGLGYKPVFIAPRGERVRELDPVHQPLDRGFLTIPVTDEQDGKTWSIGGLPFVPGFVRFFNVPNYFASLPEQLVLPRDVAQKDGLEEPK